MNHATYPGYLHSFPTRRSSDLTRFLPPLVTDHSGSFHPLGTDRFGRDVWTRLEAAGMVREDRKSTRLNSSHVATSYAVFCLKKQHRHPRSRARPTATRIVGRAG